MSAPRRLIDGGSEVARLLLRAGSDERPSSAATGKTLIALGLGGAMTAASKSAMAGSVAKGAGKAALVTRIFLATTLVSVVATTGALRWSSAFRKTLPTSAQSSAPTVAPSTRPMASASSAWPSSAITPASASASASEAKVVVKTAPTTSLATELALLETAKRALSAGAVGQCLAALDRHDREHPLGAFAQEAAVIRIEALLARGDRASARALADRFLAAHPASPYALRIERLVRDPDPTPEP